MKYNYVSIVSFCLLGSYVFYDTAEGRTGYQNIRATFRIKADASPEELMEFARFSPVFDVVTHGTPVMLQIEKV